MSSKGDKLPGHGSGTGQHAGELQPQTSVLTRQRHIAETAKNYAESALSTLSHHLDLLWMRDAFSRLNRKSATGVDNQTVDEYGKNLDKNLIGLLDRVKSGSYKASPVRRSYVPKNEKEKRPTGIPTTEIEKREDAERMLKLIPERFEEYGLTVHPEKTSLVDFRHPWVSGKKPETFDFLGFTHYWGQTRIKGLPLRRRLQLRSSVGV